MEILEAYKDLPAKGKQVRIYEVRGRFHVQMETIDEVNQIARRVRRRKRWLLYVAAENLCEAMKHLHSCRPELNPRKVTYRGTILAKDSEKPIYEVSARQDSMD
jgi:hypothetical protein